VELKAAGLTADWARPFAALGVLAAEKRGRSGHQERVLPFKTNFATGKIIF
jgi:hypothetical protein